jgi:hypothetical protein
MPARGQSFRYGQTADLSGRCIKGRARSQITCPDSALTRHFLAKFTKSKMTPQLMGKLVIYGLCTLLFCFWIIAAAFTAEHEIVLYCSLQALWFFIILLDCVRQKWLRMLMLLGIVYKSVLFLYGLQWYQSIVRETILISFWTGSWKGQDFGLTATFLDLAIFLGFLTFMAGSMILICMFGCGFVLCAPFFSRNDGNVEMVQFKSNFNVDFDSCFKMAKKYPVEDEVCCICLSAFDGTTVQSNSCLHYFHHDCIKKCIDSGHYRCPVCKQLLGNPEVKIIVIPPAA